MPWSKSKIDELRAKYDAALTPHRILEKTLGHVRRRGEIPSNSMKQAELEARAELTSARDAVLAAMTEAIAGHAAVELDAPKRA